MRPHRRIRLFLLAGLLALALSPSPSRAVSISLVPDGSTTIGIGETVNVDVFMVLDAADQTAGISAATLYLKLGLPLVDVVATSRDSVFPNALVNVVPAQHFIVFSQFGKTITSPSALLGSLSITGRARGSYDLMAATHRRVNIPLFTARFDSTNRFDFASNEALAITVACGGDDCGAVSAPIDPWWRFARPRTSILPTYDTVTIISTCDGCEVEGAAAEVVPEPSTGLLLGAALAGLALVRWGRSPSLRTGPRR